MLPQQASHLDPVSHYDGDVGQLTRVRAIHDLAVGNALPDHLLDFLDYLCQPDEVKEFSQSFTFLSILINSNLPVLGDELISACLRQMSLAYEDRHAFLVAAGKELAVLLSGQFDKLKAILERIKE